MIDLHALDNFATDHLQFEANCTRCFPNPALSAPPTDAEILCGLDRIRTLIMQGDIDDACEICEKLCSHPIEDPHVQLNVRIHKLFELVHIAENTPAGKDVVRKAALQQALQYSRQLADFALNAFPEAYELFTESMMLFAYPEGASAAFAIQERRTKLADDLVSLTRMTVCARESCLSFLIRYLLLIYLQFKSPVVTPGVELDPIEELVRDLLEHGRGPVERASRIGWTIDGSRPTKFNDRGDFKEADVQTLPERVSITRQESIESLRFTDGDVLSALKNELGRVLVNRERFRAMVVEYCAARGLRVFETAKEAATHGARGECPMLSEDQERVVVPEECIAPSAMQMFPVMSNLRRVAKHGDLETFVEAFRKIDPSLLETAPTLDFRIGQCQVLAQIRAEEFGDALRTAQEKLAPLAKRYPELLPCLSDTTLLMAFAADVKHVEDGHHRSKPERDTAMPPNDSEKDRRPRRARAGDKRVRHTRIPGRHTRIPGGSAAGKSNGDTNAGVQPFEDVLLDAFDRVVESASLESIAFEAYYAYELKFKEPELIQLLKRLLPAHDEWQTQNMMTDKFSAPIGVEEIRGNMEEGSVSVLEGSVREHGSSSGTSAGLDGEASGPATQGTDLEGQRDEQREQTVLTLMEFLAMSRAEALAVVRNHPHAENAQTIMDTLLGTML